MVFKLICSPTTTVRHKKTVSNAPWDPKWFLPTGWKELKLSQTINTWTFGWLTPDGNEGVGVEISYLEHAYSTKYYVIDQINGQINAIHDDSLESTEFTGHFSPFNLDILEQKVHWLEDQQEDEDVFSALQQPPKQQVAPQVQESDINSGLQSIDDITGIGFCSLNYSPIPQVRNMNQQQPRSSVLTSTPIANLWLDLNTSDPTQNRGKAKIIDSFTESQKPTKKLLKGGKIKSSQGIHTKMNPNWAPVHRPPQMANGGPGSLFSMWRRSPEEGLPQWHFLHKM